ncbi:hypothetical protein HK104_007127, partial [Borealophlyctis nickersoniae]
MSTPSTPLLPTNKVATVTGGSRGIGRSICQRLAQDGANVVVNYRGKAVAVQADMSKVGKLSDFLMMNAGIQLVQSLHEITEESFDKAFGVNVKGPLFLAQAPSNNFRGCLAKDLGKRGINVYVFSPNTSSLGIFISTNITRLFPHSNTISPGPTATDLYLNNKSEQQLTFAASMSPFGRIGQPDDIASVVAFLVGPDAKWVSGQNIR